MSSGWLDCLQTKANEEQIRLRSVPLKSEKWKRNRLAQHKGKGRIRQQIGHQQKNRHPLDNWTTARFTENRISCGEKEKDCRSKIETAVLENQVYMSTLKWAKNLADKKWQFKIFNKIILRNVNKIKVNLPARSRSQVRGKTYRGLKWPSRRLNQCQQLWVNQQMHVGQSTSHSKWGSDFY